MRRFALLAGLLVAAAPAHAQSPKPLPTVVIDLRGFYGGVGRDPVTAAGLGIGLTELPGRGPGGVLGVHVYPLRGRNLAIGVGGEAVLARTHAQETDDEGEATGPAVRQRFQGISGSISLNFGHRDGWSYVSAGMGPLGLGTYTGDSSPGRPPMKSTINLGAGARWFATSHVAFAFDLRFYQTRPESPTEAYPGRQRARVRVLSAGISLR